MASKTPKALGEPTWADEVVEATAEIAPENIVAEAIAPAATAAKETIMANTKTNVPAFFTDFNDRAKAAYEKGTKSFEEMNDFAKGNIEAIVESSKIAAKGFETLGQDAADYSRKSFETATTAFKGFASVKTPTELFKLQSDFAKSAFDSLVAETSKNTEAMIKLAGEVAQPISNRVAVAVEKVKVAA